MSRPNIQLYFSPVSYTKVPPRTRPLLTLGPFAGFLLGYSACRPKSRGSLEIANPDPVAAPVIRPNCLSHESDIEDMVDGWRYMRRLAATPPLAAVIDSEMAPSPTCQSEAAIINDIGSRAGSVFHLVSTCMMGSDPREAVVDHRLKVHSLSGLRVVDASVCPCVTSGNTNAPTIMLAEKAADVILMAEWSRLLSKTFCMDLTGAQQLTSMLTYDADVLISRSLPEAHSMIARSRALLPR